jgi:hypothetical protein
MARQWKDGLLYVNPANGTILVDSGPLAGGRYRLTFYMATSNGAGFQGGIEHRDAANLTTLQSQMFPCVLSWVETTLLVAVEEYERVRLVTQQDVTGTVEAMMIVEHGV